MILKLLKIQDRLLTRSQQIKLLINTIPFLGILAFIFGFLFSTSLYPGGSQADINAIGFDWMNNYWCNLMNEKGMNGAPNPARPFSIAAMVILCFSFMIFFIQFAEYFVKARIWEKMIRYGGILSMCFAMLIFTEFHDIMTIISSGFGVFVVLGIIIEIYKSDLQHYKTTGIICLALLALNNYIYYSTHLIEYLPLLQKITFSIVLIWVFGLNLEIRKKISAQTEID